jgi:hypothetical protein
MGPQVLGMCDKLDLALLNFKRGISTYLMIRVPFRHFKSQTVSRTFPAFVGAQLWHADPEIMTVGSDEGLTVGFSRDSQGIVQSDAYSHLFPGVEIHKTYQAGNEWAFAGRRSRVRAFGFGSRKIGRGATILIVDDWCGSREEAENADLRQKAWDSFRNDLITRLAPVHIVAVVGTPWHVDGLQERILKEMKVSHDFPQFDVTAFPARKKNEQTGEWDYLCTQKYPESWYRMQYANLTPYEAAGLLDVNPQSASGNMASSKWYWKVARPPEGIVTKKIRYWDTAATKSKTSDFTSGGKIWKYNDNKECIVSITMERVPFAQVGDTILRQAEIDGKDTEIWIEFEKGSMGIVGPAALAMPMLSKGFTVRLAKRPSGAKHTIWQSMFTKAWQMRGSGQGMPIVEGPNVDTFLSHVNSAPDPEYDDDLDSVSGAHNAANGLCESESVLGNFDMRMV